MAAGQFQEELSALLEQHAGIVRKVATTYCRDVDDRADLAQEIIAQLWAGWPRYDRARPFTTWMYRVALNVAISHVRGAYRTVRHFVPLAEEHEGLAEVPVDYEKREQLSALRELIETLDPLNRALLLLHLDERNHREIADILGISESNVGTRIARIKQHFRRQLG